MLSDDLFLNLSFLNLFLMFMNAQQVTSGKLKLFRLNELAIYTVIPGLLFSFVGFKSFWQNSTTVILNTGNY